MKIDAIYAFYPESSCNKNLAIRKVFVFSDSEPDEENVDVQGGEDGDGEGQEQGEDKGDPSVPVQTFAQAVLQSF